jgi:outer membrane phospholipase A
MKLSACALTFLVPVATCSQLIAQTTQTTEPARAGWETHLPPQIDPARADATSTDPGNSTSPALHTGFVEFLSDRLAPFEPMYIVAGTERPNAKFQISLRYQIFNNDGGIAKTFPPLSGLNLAYSQTSFWDLKGKSKPFFDNSYRPELNLFYDDIVDPDELSFFSHIGLIAGVQHESNGDDGTDSRNMNFVYIRPMFTVGDRDNDGLFITFAPRVHTYFGDMSNNSDIERYRGYFDLRFIVGQGGGLQAAFTGRIGSGWDKGSIQMDLTYPLRKLLFGSVDFYADLQVFNGFGESLKEYDQSDTTVRIGVALVR